MGLMSSKAFSGFYGYDEDPYPCYDTEPLGDP